MHAWYSAKMAKLCGTVTYADAQGQEVVCTTVGHSDQDSGTEWSDIQYLGPVERYVRTSHERTAHIRDNTLT